MGINTTTRGIISLVLITIVLLGLAPTVHELANSDELWNTVIDSRALALREYAIYIFYVTGLVGYIATVIWMLNASSSKGGFTAYG